MRGPLPHAQSRSFSGLRFLFAAVVLTMPLSLQATANGCSSVPTIMAPGYDALVIFGSADADAVIESGGMPKSVDEPLVVVFRNAQIPSGTIVEKFAVGPFSSATLGPVAGRGECVVRAVLTPRMPARWHLEPRGPALIISSQRAFERREARFRQVMAQLGAPATGQCSYTSTLDRIEAAPGGILLYGSGDLVPLLERTKSFDEQGFESFFEISIDLPGTAVGSVNLSEAWNDGPFAAVRVSRYRTGTRCGVRLRLTARTAGRPDIVPRENAWFIGAHPAEPAAAEAELGGTNRSGSAVVSGSASSVKFGPNRQTDVTVQAGLAQRLGTSTLAATVGVNPSNTFAAAAIENLVFDPGTCDLAAGDLVTRFGETGNGGASAISQLTFRGGGVNFRWPARLSGQVFWGRSSPTLLVREDGAVGSEARLTRSRLFGAQLGWVTPNERWGFGTGWLRSGAGEGPAQENFHVASSYERGQDISVHAILEESLARKAEGGWRRGYAATLQPRVETEQLTVGGYARTVSSEFRAPKAASYFAGLRHSYSLFASYRPVRRLTLSASLAQTKTFNILDPRDVGTLREEKAAGVAYRMRRDLSAFGEVSRSSAATDRGAVIEENSVTRRVGGGLVWMIPRGSLGLRVSDDVIDDRSGSRDSIHMTRFRVDGARYLRDRGEVMGGVEYLISRQADVNHLISGDLQYRIPSRSDWSFGLDARDSVTFAGGVAIQQWSAAVDAHHQGGWLNGGIRAGYQRLLIRDQPSRGALFASVYTNHRFDWGPYPRPGIPYAAGSLPLMLGRSGLDFLSRVTVTVYADANGDGRRSAGESGIEGVLVNVDGKRGISDQSGVVDFDVVPGKHTVTLGKPLTVTGYLIPDPAPKSLTADPGERLAVSVPLLPAGVLRGRVEIASSSAALPPTVLESISVRATSAGVTRTAVTSPGGDFDFGRIPEGKYLVSIDPQTLAPGTVVIEPQSVEIEVKSGLTATVTFTIRKATARERFGSLSVILSGEAGS